MQIDLKGDCDNKNCQYHKPGLLSQRELIMKINKILACILIIAISAIVGSCTNHSPTKPPVPTLFVGSLSLVVLTELEGEPVGLQGVSVLVGEAHQVDPGPYTYDTVFTNQYGVAFFEKVVRCGTYEASGKLTIKIGDSEPFAVLFKNDEDIDIIIRR
jgi:hypothetical protein